MNITEIDGSERRRQPTSLSSTHVVALNPQLAHGYNIYYFSSTSVAPYSIILSILKLTGLWSLVKLLFWAQRSGKIIWLTPWSAMHLMPKTRVSLPLAPFLMKVSLRLPRVFASYIYSVPSLFFFISLWLIFKRETERDRRFWLCQFSFYSRHFICHQSSGFSSKNQLNSKFLFLLYIIYL